MKTILLFFALLLGLEASSQNYYSGDYAKGTNVTFKCTTMFSDRRVISNVNNKYVMTQQVLRNGNQAGPDSYRKVQYHDLNHEKLHNIIRAAFTPAELVRLKKANVRLVMDIIIAPTGEVIEVGFLIPQKSPLMSVKPDTFYQIEQGIKAQITMTLDMKTQELYPWLPDLLGVDLNEL